MLVYFFIQGIIYLWSCLCCLGEKTLWKRAAFIVGAFGLLWFVSAFRWNVGYDYFMYAEGFYKMGMEGFSTLTYLDWEPGFVLFTKCFVALTRNMQLYMAVLAAMTLAGPAYLVYHYSKMPCLSVTLYINLYFFYCTTNMVRQSIALSICMFAYVFMMRRKPLPFLLLVLLACSFHMTAVVMLPLYFLVLWKADYKLPVLYGYLLLAVMISSNGLLDIVTEYLHSEYQDSVFLTEGISGVHFVIPILLLTATILLIKRIERSGSKRQLMMANTMYYGIFFMATMLKHSILERLSYYAYIVVIIFVPELLIHAKSILDGYVDRRTAAKLTQQMPRKLVKKTLRKAARLKAQLGYGMATAVVVLALLYNFYGLAVPDKGVHGVYPYQSWLFPTSMQVEG